MAVPPLLYSGYNYSKFTPALQYVYDSSIQAYRAVTPSDLAGSGVVGSTSLAAGSQIGISGINTGVVLQVKDANTNNVNTSSPSGANGVVLAANPNRLSFYVQNLNTGSPLYVKYGVGAHSTSFNVVLKADVGSNDAGQGGILLDTSYRGIVSASGSFGPRFISWETTS